MSSEDEDDALYDAVFHNEEEVANFFLSKKLKETSEESLLHIAVQKRNLRVLELLLQRGCNINEKHENESLLEIAIRKGFPDVVESLIKNGADLNVPTKISIDKYNESYTFLHIAVEIGNLEIIKLLLKNGIGVNPKTKPGVYPEICYDQIDENYEVHSACYYFMRLQSNNVFRRTLSPLEVAIVCYANRGNAVLELLLKSGADVNVGTQKVFPIHLSIIESEDVSQIEKLLEFGADVNSICDHLKYTPLSHAMLLGKEKTVSYLLEKGATFNKYTIDSVFHDVVARPFDRNLSEKYLTLLIDFGANINSRNGSGKLALHLLISKEFDVANYFRLLIDYGSDLNAKDFEGDTPLHWALKKKNYLAAQTLILYECDISLLNERGDSPSQILTSSNRIYLNILKSRFTLYRTAKLYMLFMKSSSPNELSVFLLIQATILKELTGRYVDQKDLNVIKTDFGFLYEFLRKNLEELKLIKVKRKLSYYDILTKTITYLETHLNERLIKDLHASDIEKDCPIFALMLKVRLERIKERQILLEFCEKRFKYLFGLKNHLPIIIREKISSYLSSVDLVTLWRIFKKKNEHLSKFFLRSFKSVIKKVVREEY